LRSPREQIDQFIDGAVGDDDLVSALTRYESLPLVDEATNGLRQQQSVL
jgi:hypothetical protein